MGLFQFKKNKPKEKREVKEPKQEIHSEVRKETTLQMDWQVRKLSYQVANLQGVGARARQEDSFAFVNVFDVTEIQKNGLMFIVADGMGGMKDGKLASETAIASMRESFQRMDRSGDMALQLQDSAFNASNQVLQVLGGDGGSTVVACILFQEELYYVSVGDSFLYLMRDGQLYRLNREHNLLNRLYLASVRAGNMTKVSTEDPEAAALTQFLGMDGMDEVDFIRKPLPVQEGDIFLACSDGVGGALPQETILSCMESEIPQDICNALEMEIAAQGNEYQDNYTALVVRCIY